MNTLEDDWIGGQEEVEDSVNERHVDGQQKDDWLGEEEADWTRKVLGEQFAQVDLDFFLLGVDAPVTGSAAELRSFLDQDNWCVGLLEPNNVHEEGGKPHDSTEVLGPSPSEVRLGDEATDERSKDWSAKYSRGEDCNGNSSRPVIEHIREDGCNDRQWTCSGKSSEETTDHDSLDVSCCCNCDFENGEHEHGNNQRQFTALKLRKWCPDGWSSSESKDEKRDSKGGRNLSNMVNN